MNTEILAEDWWQRFQRLEENRSGISEKDFYFYLDGLLEERQDTEKPQRWEIDRKHYITLELKPYVDMEEVKKAYRAFAKKLHPDTNPSKFAHHQFRKILHAYEELKREKTIDDLFHEIVEKWSKNKGKFKQKQYPQTSTVHFAGETVRSGKKRKPTRSIEARRRKTHQKNLKNRRNRRG